MAEQSLSTLENRVRAQFEKARQALAEGEPAYARDVCQSLLERHPGCAELRGLLRKAQSECFNAQRRGLRCWTAWSCRLLVMRAAAHRRRKPFKALAMIERALSRNPEQPGAYRVLGFIALDLDFPETATAAFEAWCRLRPGAVGAWVALGTALLRGGKEKEAVAAAEAAVQIDPSNGEALELLKTACVAFTLRSSSAPGSQTEA